MAAVCPLVRSLPLSGGVLLRVCRRVKCADMSIFRAINFRKGVVHTRFSLVHSLVRHGVPPFGMRVCGTYMLMNT